MASKKDRVYLFTSKEASETAVVLKPVVIEKSDPDFASIKQAADALDDARGKGRGKGKPVVEPAVEPAVEPKPKGKPVVEPAVEPTV